MFTNCHNHTADVSQIFTDAFFKEEIEAIKIHLQIFDITVSSLEAETLWSLYSFEITGDDGLIPMDNVESLDNMRKWVEHRLKDNNIEI